MNVLSRKLRLVDSTWLNPGARRVLACAALLVICGCGKASDAPDLAEAVGVITFEDGQPVKYATITFQSEKSGVLSIGATDEEGKFRMLYKKGTWGAPVGPNLVAIRPGTNAEGENGTAVPVKYGTIESADLQATVEESGPNNFDFKISKE